MIKRTVIFLVVIVALFYAVSGFYFYHKSFHKKSPASATAEDAGNPIAYDTTQLVIFKNVFIDFEAGSNDNTPVSDERFYAGSKSLHIESDREYACEVSQPFNAILSSENLRKIEVNFKYSYKTNCEALLLVVEIVDEKGKTVSWQSEGMPGIPNKGFQSSDFIFSLKPEFMKSNYRSKIYFWNKSKCDVFIDDFQIVYQGINMGEMAASEKLRQSSFFYDLETDSMLEGRETLSEEISHSGKRSSFINGKDEYSVIICNKVKDVTNEPLKMMSGSVWLYPLSDNVECTLTFEIKNTEGEQLFYNGKDTRRIKLIANTWQKLNALAGLSEEDSKKIRLSDEICVYVYNTTRTKIYADDFTIVFGSIPSPRGLQTFADLNKSNDLYHFVKNHPPYPVTKFEKTNIVNADSPFLVSTSSFNSGDLKPHHQILSGKFASSKNDNDQLLVLKEDGLFLYAFCSSSQRFVLQGKSGSIIKNAKILKGDFSGDSKDELLVISGNNMEIISFNKSNTISCTDNENEINFDKIWTGPIESAYKIFTGKFSVNNKDQLLLISKEGHCLLKSFTGNTWKTITENDIPKEMVADTTSQLAGNFGNSFQSLLSVYKKNISNKAALINFSGKKVIIKEVSKRNDVIFQADDQLFTLGNQNRYTSVLALNTGWRFYLRTINYDEEGFYVESTNDFAGFVSDRNPKYYECVKLIPGQFTGKQNILCILYNCVDKGYDGGKCYKYDSLADLPNSIQLYTIGR